MPVRKVPGGYQWGQSGKVYPTKEQAERQGRAAYASGYSARFAGRGFVLLIFKNITFRGHSATFTTTDYGSL